jgi:hypothetical protein
MEPPGWGSVVRRGRVETLRPWRGGNLIHVVPARVSEGVEPPVAMQWPGDHVFLVEVVDHGVLEPLVVSDLEGPGAAPPQEQHLAIQLLAEIHPGRARTRDVGRCWCRDKEPKDPERQCAIVVDVSDHHKQAAPGPDEVAVHHAVALHEDEVLGVVLAQLHIVVHEGKAHVALGAMYRPERDDALVGPDGDEAAVEEDDILRPHPAQAPRREPAFAARAPERGDVAGGGEHDGGDHVGGVGGRRAGERGGSHDERELGVPRGPEPRRERDALAVVEVVERVPVARAEREDEPAAVARAAEARGADVVREQAEPVVAAGDRAVERGRLGVGEDEPREQGRQRRERAPHPPHGSSTSSWRRPCGRGPRGSGGRRRRGRGCCRGRPPTTAPQLPRPQRGGRCAAAESPRR